MSCAVSASTKRPKRPRARRSPRSPACWWSTKCCPAVPADGTLQPGDVLVRVNGKLVSEFEPLEQVTDDGVGGSVDLELERGGKPVSAKLNVGDLHAITPSAYLEFGDAVVHTVSYQMARHFNVAVNGVYVANPGYIFGAAGVPRGAVIASANGKPTPNLAAFEAVVTGLADGERFTVRYSTVDDPNGSSVRSARMDRRWFPARHCLRDDAAGLWQCAPLPALGSAKPETGGATRFARPEDPRAAALAPSLVGVGFDMPYSVSGITERNYRGTGPGGRCRARAGGRRSQHGAGVHGRCAHHLRGHARDSRQGGIRASAAQSRHRQLRPEAHRQHAGAGARKLSDRRIMPGETLWVVGMGADSELNVAPHAGRGAEAHPVAAVAHHAVPREQSRDHPAGERPGRLRRRADRFHRRWSSRLWSSFAWESGRELQQENRGVAIGIVQDMLRRVQTKQPVYSLEAELVPQPLAAARRLGLSDAWLKKLEDASPNQRQVLVHRATGRRIARGGPAEAGRSCCWPSTRRWSRASARSSWPSPTRPRSTSRCGATAKRRSCRWPPRR